MTGKVLYRDKPLEFGVVMFRLKDGVEISRGVIQPDGTFQMNTREKRVGADVGLNVVRIICHEAQKPNGHVDLRFGPLGKPLIPEKYTEFDTSGLVVDVRPDKNDLVVFELTDK